MKRTDPDQLLYHRLYSVKRRASLRAEGLCINGRSHGKAMDGVLCTPCRLVHRSSGVKNVEVSP